jgi:ribonuclease BN (tRNA processing enzyme)
MVLLVVRNRTAILLVALCALASGAEKATVVLLGSGTPIPDPASSGPALAIVVNGKAYLFDAGAGVVRRAEAAAETHHIPALDAPNLTRLFLTHLHSDHTLGYPDLILTPWVVGRQEPLEVYGPKGTAAMTDHIKAAYAADIQMRSQGLEHLPPRGLEVKVHEITEGPVYKDENISVRAIRVLHGSWAEAFGYAVNASGRTIVISGDTAPCAALAEACAGCDVLVHEVYSAEKFGHFSPGARRYHSSFHTSTSELAELASKAKPKLLLLYHQLYFGPQEEADMEGEIRKTYSGKVVNGHDLGVY